MRIGALSCASASEWIAPRARVETIAPALKSRLLRPAFIRFPSPPRLDASTPARRLQKAVRAERRSEAAESKRRWLRTDASTPWLEPLRSARTVYMGSIPSMAPLRSARSPQACEYISLPGTSSSALRIVPLSDSVMYSVVRSGQPNATFVVCVPMHDLIRYTGSPRRSNTHTRAETHVRDHEPPLLVQRQSVGPAGTRELDEQADLADATVAAGKVPARCSCRAWPRRRAPSRRDSSPGRSGSARCRGGKSPHRWDGRETRVLWDRADR